MTTSANLAKKAGLARRATMAKLDILAKNARLVGATE